MAKKRKTVEASKPSLEPPQLAVMKNGRQAAADPGAGLANAKAEKMSPPAAKRKKTAKKSATPAPDSESDTSGILNSHDFDESVPEEDVNLPPKDDLQILLNRIEMQLPKDDHVKYDSRARKLDWEQIKFKEFSAEDCKKYWEYIQARIRRFRILAEMIPDARTWLSQPWTNFYKSKDHNRHPEMPKKPLSMYMLYYSERREQIQKKHPTLSMPDVAKICSDEYQKLPQESKDDYKSRCDEMRKNYDTKLENFYRMYPDLKPVKQEKSSKTPGTPKQTTVRPAEPEKPVILLPGAPQKPGKPFDLYFQQLLDTQTEPSTERGVLLERARQEWRDMKVKKKAKWIRKAMKEFQDYEEQVVDFKSKHPEFNPPSVKSFLTQEEQKILDKYMGRPEKPPSSAYSLFSKEMLNTEEIKQFPSKERMSHISESWKRVTEADKEIYQTKVNEAMTKYKSEYNDWFESLSVDEQRAEKERTSQKSNKKSVSSIPLAAATNTIIAGAAGAAGVTSNTGLGQAVTAGSMMAGVQAAAVQLPTQPIYTQLPTNLQPLPQQTQQAHPQQLQNIQMPITVPYPNMSGGTGATTPMLVKVEVVGAAGSQPHVTHAQIMPQMTYNMTQNYSSQVSYATQPFTMQVAPVVTQAQPVAHTQVTPLTQQTMAPAPMAAMQAAAPSTTLTPMSVIKPEKEPGLRSEILRREPVEPARSPKQLFLSDYVKKQRKRDKKSTDQKLQSDGKEIWKITDKKDKKKWLKMLEPQRQKYIEAYTVFVRGLNKEELELYTEMKARRDAEDEAKRAVESSDEEDSDTSEEESDTDSESGSDSDI